MTTDTKLDRIIELLAMLVASTTTQPVETRGIRGARYTMQTINEELAKRRSPFDDLATPAEHG